MTFARRHGWEGLLALLIVAAGAWSASLSPYYLNVDQLLLSTKYMIIPGLLALGLVPVVVMGEIDISLPSILALNTVLLSILARNDVPIALALPAIVATGAACGLANGLLVGLLELPSLAVTLGSLGAIRALAFLLGGDSGFAGFGPDYTSVGANYLGSVPMSLVLFAVAATCFVVLMHRAVFGRAAFAVGANAEAARFSGIRTARAKIAAFTLGGVMAALGALVFVGQYGSARADNADGILLFLVTAVVLGGVDINGGRGTVVGVVLALLLLATLSNGMGLANVPAATQTIVIGVLLVSSVLLPRLLGAARRRLMAMGEVLPRLRMRAPPP
jgi:rhamnose transport system permease protein